MILFVIFTKSIKNSPFLFEIKIENPIFASFNKNFITYAQNDYLFNVFICFR